jgi:hypothetical protein
MKKTHALALVVLLFGCKSQEEKRVELARAQLAQAQEQALKAQEQLASAHKQLAESADKLGQQGEALGAQGAALGMQAAAAGLQAAGAALTGLAGAAAGAGKAPLVDFRELKALLPEKVGGLSRVSASGEKSGAMGVGVSHAEGKYKGDGGARLKLKISDVAGMGGMGAAMFGLAMVDVDKETDDGYEKTSTVGGRKSFEKYSGKSRRGELKLLVGNRFVVEIDGDDVAMNDIKDAASKLDLAKLERLAVAAK